MSKQTFPSTFNNLKQISHPCPYQFDFHLKPLCSITACPYNLSYPPFYQWPLTSLKLKRRYIKALYKYKILTIDHLFEFGINNIKRIQGVGKMGINDIKQLLQDLNRHFSHKITKKKTNSYFPDCFPLDNSIIDKNIKDLGLGQRLETALLKAGITTLKILLTWNEQRLAGCLDIGDTSINKLKNYITTLGFNFNMTFTEDGYCMLYSQNDYLSVSSSYNVCVICNKHYNGNAITINNISTPIPLCNIHAGILTNSKYDKIYALRQAGHTYKYIASTYNISIERIRQIIINKHKHLSLITKFIHRNNSNI